MSALCPLILAAVAAGSAAAREARMDVRHPNLFLNPAEIEGMRRKVDAYAWASELYQHLRERAADTIQGGHRHDAYYDRYEYPGTGKPLPPGHTDRWLPNAKDRSAIHYPWCHGRRLRDVALVYVISREPQYGNAVREGLMHYADRYRDRPVTMNSFTHAMGGINLCWAYDLIHDHLSLGDRAAIEDFFLRWADKAMAFLGKKGIGNKSMLGRAFCCTVGCALGNRELIDFAIEARGGLKDAIEVALWDQAIYYEASAYELQYVSSAMAVMAEAAWHHDRIDLYHWKSPSGRSIKDFYDTCLRLAFPVDLRLTTYGDNSSQSPVVSEREMHTGHQSGESYLINDRDGRDWNKVDLAYRRYQDPAYAWVLSRNPKRDEWDHAVWGHLGLTHGDPLPDSLPAPDARSSVFPKSGIAMLRAQEGPAYWTSRSPAVSIRFGPQVGHGHRDQFHISFHGKGTLLEPDWFVQWDYGGRRGGRNPTPWSAHTVAHNTVLVDRKCAPPQRSALPVPETDFGSAAKQIRIAGTVCPGVVQSRTLVLTKEYLLDVFANHSDRERTYDWLLHALGRLNVPGVEAELCDLGAELGFGVIDTAQAGEPENRWIRNGMAADLSGTLSAVWTQESGIGVKLIVLGAEGTTVRWGDGPHYVSSYGTADTLPDGQPRAVPLVAVRRRAASTIYIALHEPFDSTNAPRLVLRQVCDRDGVVLLEVKSEDFLDLLLYARDLAGPHELATEAGSFRFSGGYAFVRLQRDQVIAQGRLEEMLLPVPGLPPAATFLLNGRPTAHARRNGSLVYPRR